MFPSFVIHHSNHVERDEVVKDILEKSKATMFEAYLLPDGLRGNLMSHVGVAKLARSMAPNKHYIVFEDDCELLDHWEETLKGAQEYDVVYIGYTDRCEKATFGTHALCLSPRARDMIIQKAVFYANDTERKNAFDWILSKMCREEGLTVAMPKMEYRETFCRQKRGIKSTVTGEVRT
jgi:hypothetical protein